MSGVVSSLLCDESQFPWLMKPREGSITAEFLGASGLGQMWSVSEKSLSLDWLFFRCLQLRTINNSKVANLGLAYSGALFGARWGGRGQRGEGKKPGGCGAWQERFAFSREGDDQCHSHTQGASLGLAP